ncbi:protein translocase subunit yidC [Humitalea rosea]|uniref:Membrane protein insertase YidC n=1 Tax=Humitalea rosea TaxID=990373 RepID=A0A2W7I0J0_9PROT|nr:membrane protein insertase YidC [Humitalea rosea]PZW39838.1 protein translocase subunit yidC [Humitalea rosea]
MDNKRLLAAIALSIGILLLFDVYNRATRETPLPRLPQETAQQAVPATPAPLSAVPLPGGAATRAPAMASAAPAAPAAARVVVDSPRLFGSVNLRGARLDDLVLRGYRETTEPNSPLVRMFADRDDANPYFAQWGWTAADGHTAVPAPDTDWAATAGTLSPSNPVTLSWDNGAGVTYEIGLSLDANYMFTADQRIVNRTDAPISVLPWARVRRERTPHLAGFYILHEGFVGVIGERLTETSYSNAKSEAEKRSGTAMEQDSPGGWAGFTDKYWLAALMPADQTASTHFAYRHVAEGGNTPANDRWQVDIATPAPITVAAGETGRQATRLFAGAKEVRLLDSYRETLNVIDFDKAIDFGWFYFMTKPFFYLLDWIFGVVGNFGVSILIMTFLFKLAFFPLANKSYKSMSKMKLLGPKMTELKERHKDDPGAMQKAMMQLYKTEKINPASGCLPILIQIPVFFSLYKVLFVTIEMRHQPFFGWIHDLSSPDPTNLFTAFGLIPWDAPSFLHLPAWAIVMGITMFLQFKLNPAPPDPVQAKVFAFMPLIFTFMLASFPAGLVIYWSWNNLLSISQQYYIMRGERAKKREERALIRGKR